MAATPTVGEGAIDIRTQTSQHGAPLSSTIYLPGKLISSSCAPTASNACTVLIKQTFHHTDPQRW